MRNKSVSSSSASPNYTCGMPFPMRIQPLDSEAYREASIRNEVATATAKPVLKSRLKKLLDGILKNPGAKKLVAGDSSDDELDESITAPSCDDSLDILKILIPCANIAERHLLADTSKIIDKNKTCKRKGDLRKIVTDGLLLLGYDASICISRWEKSPSFPAGEYEYIDVIVDGGERIFVDIDFRSEFEMARPTGGYKSILQSLPHIFVGRSDRLLHIVSIVSEAARQSIKERGMHLPPWRKAEYMRARWLSPHSRITAAAVAQPDATVLKEESLSGDLELIFSKETSSGKDIGAVGSEALSPVENLGEEKKYTWQPPAIERKCCERGTKVVNGLASLLGERLSSCGDERITVFTTNHNRMDSEICRELRECKLFPEVRMNPERCSENFRIKAESCWDSVELEHPATLEELGMDPENKGLISDFLGFVRDKEFHKSMGRSCGDNCLVYNSPGGTERSSVIAAMANYLKFDIYHLDLSNFSSLSELFNMLLSTKNRSVIAIEGLYQCAGMLLHLETDEYAVHLLLNEIDKQSFLRRSNERIIVFTTNHRDQHDAASLRPVGMDIYIHMSSPQPIALPDGAYHNSLLVSNSEKENTREAYDSTKPYSLPNFDATGNKAVKVDSRWGRECWHSMELEQPPTFAELGKDPENEGIISDLLSFIRDKELYKRIGKIWTRGYLLCDSPGTNRWSLIAAMANCLEFDNYDLDLTGLSSIEELLNVLISIRNRSLIVIKDFDHWFEMHPNLKNEVFPLRHEDEVFPLRHENELTLSGLFEIIDGLVSCCWDEQIIVLTTSHNHRDRPLNLDAYMHTSSPRPIALPYGGEIVLLDSSEQKPLVDFDAANNMAYQGSVLVSNSEKENMRETSKRQCMTESVLSPDDSTTRISFTDFDAPDYRADLVRAYQSGPIMFTSENKDTRDGLYGECLTKSVLSDDDSTKQELLPEHTNLVFFSELTSEDINGFYDFVDSDSDDFDKFDDGAGMLPNVKDEFVDDLSSSCGDERITVSSTNQRDPHDAALLPLVNMDTDIHTASPQPIALPHSGEIVQLDSSEQKSLVDFDATNNSAYQSGVLLSSEKTNTIEACKGRWESLIQRTKKDMGEGLNGECLAKSILNLDDSTKRSSANTRRGRGCLPSIELEQPANNHHVGSAPSVNPSLWDRRHPCSGESPNAAGFHPGSLGKMRISNSPIHLDFVSQNMFPHVGGNCMDLSISSKNVGLHSPHLMFPGRGQISPVMSSFDSPNEWTRSRRNDGNSNQADSKKLYDLDIDRIGRGQDNRTTLVIKNIPNNFKHRYTSKMLLAAIDEGHRGTYDFVYLPIDFKNKCNVGYAFINMTDPSSIIPFYQAFNGKKWEKFNSEKVASLAYARIQGKAALIAHLQNSSLMNEAKRCRPILFNTDGPNAGDQKSFKVLESLPTLEQPNYCVTLLSLGSLTLEGCVQDEKSPDLQRVLQINGVEQGVTKLPRYLGGLTAQFASSSRWPINLPYGIHIVVLDPLEQSTQNVAHAAREDQFSPTVSLPEKKMVRKALKRECRTWSVLFEIHQQHFGIRCEGAAKSFHATRICRKHRINRVSTVKRIHKHGIHQWPVRQKSRKEYHRGNKRPFKLSSVSMDDKLDSKLQFIHMSQFARSSPQPLVVLDGGEIVRPTALSSSEFAAANNIAHLVGQDQSSYTASHYEGISRREMSDKQGLTMSLFSVGDFQQHFGCKHKDAVKRLRVISMFKSTCRQHWVYWWPCRFEYIERQAFDDTNNRAKLVKADQSSPTVSNSEKGSTREALKRDWLTNVPRLEDLRQYFGARRKDAAKGLGDFLSWKSFKVLESLPLGEQSNDIRHSVRQRTLTHKHCVRQKISQDLPQSLQRYCSGGLAAQPAIGLPDGRHILSLSEKKIVGKTFKRKCRPMSVLSLEHHQQHADRRWEDPGKSLGAKRICRQLIIHRASTVKRVRRQHGIHRWPFQQNWETMKGYSLQEERPDDVISSSTNGKLVSRLQLIHISWLGRFSPRPPALPPGGEIVGPLALSSSQLPSTSNRAQLVGQDQSGSTASHSEKKRTREPEGLKGTTKNFTIEDLQPYVGLKRADAAKRLCISESSFKRTCRKLGIERWPYFPTGEVWKPPDPHEKNTRQIEMVNEVVGHLPEPIDVSRPPDPDERNTEPTEMENEIDRLLHEPNEFLQGFSDDPSCWNTENGSTVEISETPTIFDSMDLDIEFGMENFEEARGSRERVFQVTYETTLSTAYPNPNPNEFVQPQVASTQFVSGNMRIPNDQRNSSASQAETRLEGHGTGSTCSNLALSQPMFTLSQMMPPFTSSQDTRSVRLKVYYGSEIIIFQFPLTSGINELKGEVAMRLNLEQDSFNMKYEDDEGEKILIPIDKDLRNYLSSSVNPVIKLWIANKVANPTNLCESCGGSLKR